MVIHNRLLEKTYIILVDSIFNEASLDENENFSKLPLQSFSNVFYSCNISLRFKKLE